MANKQLPEPEILTEKEAIQFLRLSRVTLWQLRKTGRLTFLRQGDRVLYRRRDLLAFLDSIQQGVTKNIYAKT